MARADWTPDERHTAALTYARERGYRYSVTDLCAEIGIGRRTYYDWFANPAFDAWWQRGWQEWFTRELPGVYGDLRAGEANAHSAKLLIERFDRGYKPQSRQEQVHSGGVNVDLSDMDEDELRRHAEAAGESDA